MKTNTVATRALAGMIPAIALLATPALAQDAAQPAPAPPAPPAAAPVPPPPPVAATPPVSSGPTAEDRAKYEASLAAATGTAGSDSDAASDAAPVTETRRAPARPAARAPVQSVPVRAAPATPAAVAPAVTAAPTPAPTATTPVADATAQPDAPMTTPVPDATDGTATATTETTTTETAARSGGLPFWVWVLGALAILGAIAAFVGLRRKRDDDVVEPAYAEPVYVEPAHVEPAYVEPAAAAPIAAAPIAAAPIAAAPIAAAAPDTPEPVAEDHAEVATPAADEVAAITAASAPVTGRPWIELSLRPVCADATTESAVVELELTLANAGEVEARDVRVTTFMLGDADAAPSDMNALLASGGHGGTEVDAGEIGAGEGSRVDATLTVSRDGIDGSTYRPIVVADVRYTLPDGGEGRTAAAFALGVDDGTDEPSPLRLGDARDDVSATLHGMLERV